VVARWENRARCLVVICHDADCCTYARIKKSSLVLVRISSTLLKPAACLLLSGSAVLGCTSARALTFNWLTTGSGATGSGTFEIANASVSDGVTYSILYGGGTLDGTAIYTISGNFKYQSGTTNWLLNSTGLNFALGDGRTSILSHKDSLNPSSATYSTANFLDRISDSVFNVPVTSARASVGSLADPRVSASVPGPLPLFGATAAFGWSRRLRRKIKQADFE